MLIHLKVKDNRFGAGFKSVFFHENDITPEIYNFVKKKKDKILSIDFKGIYYWHTFSPNISDFLTDYKHLLNKQKAEGGG